MLWEQLREAHHGVRMAALGVNVANTDASMALVIAEDSELATLNSLASETHNV